MVPLAVFPTAASRWSSLRPTLRAPSSGPWQAQPWFERIGRTSRVKSTADRGSAPRASVASPKAGQNPDPDKAR